MKKINLNNTRVLIWSRAYCTNHETQIWKIFSRLKAWECRHVFDYKNARYDSQQDFDKIVEEYDPHIIAVYNINTANMPVRVPNDKIIMSYWDMPVTQFYLFGMEYFKHFRENDYIILPFLDYQLIDIDNVCEKLNLSDKIIVYPFVPNEFFLSSPDDIEEDKARFSADVVLALNRKEMGPYFTYHNVNGGRTACNNKIIQLDVELARLVHKTIIEQEGIFNDFDWIEKLVISVFDKFNFWQFTNNKEQLIERWKREVIVNFFCEEYAKCIVDWLCEGDFNFKLWGPRWQNDPKYYKVAAGAIPEGSTDIYKIYRYSKMSVNSAISLSLHRRLFESISEKCMVLQSVCMREECDLSRFEHYFVSEESIVTCNGKRDLLSKIDYYLSHDAERNSIAQRAYDVLHEQHLTHDEVMLDVADKIANIVSQFYS